MNPRQSSNLPGGRHIAIVATCCLTCGIPAAMILSTAGIFYPVIASDLGVPTAKISAWMSASMLASAFLSPLVGNLIARYNVRHFMMLGVVVCAGAFFIFSVSYEPWMFWVAGGCTGFTLVTCLSLLPTVLVNRWFGRHVGLILGLCTSFTGIGGVVFLALGQGIIDEYGWRAAYAAFAVIALVVCLPVICFSVREKPADCGLQPYGVEASVSAEAEVREAPVLIEDEAVPQALSGAEADAPSRGTALEGVRSRVGIAAARDTSGPPPETRSRSGGDSARRLAGLHMRTASFWLLIVCGFFMNMVSQANGYFPLYISWLEDQVLYGAGAAAFTTGSVLLALSQVGNAAGKVFLGAAMDFSPGKALGALGVCGALGIAFVWLSPQTPLVAAGGLVFGMFIAGGIVLLPLLVRSVFGSGEEYPLLLSWVGAAPTAGSAVGNILFPWLAEGAGGFDSMFACILACVVVVIASGWMALASRKRNEQLDAPARCML